MRFGVRAHDIPASDPLELCQKLQTLGIREIQLVAHKSFPGFCYDEQNIRDLAAVFAAHNIQVMIYGCYIDPLTVQGQERFLEHIRYATILGADAIATESAVGLTQLQEDEEVYQQLVPAFRRFAEETKKVGVRAAIETVYAHPICSPEKTLRLLEDVGSDNLYVILDPVNLAHYENDPRVQDYTREAIHAYGERILVIHWKERILDRTHPAVRFAKNSEDTILITEGLMPEEIQKIKI